MKNPASAIFIKAALKFHFWTTGRKILELPTSGSHREELLAFLKEDRSFRYIRSYDDFCHLSALIKGHGYDTTEPPCSPAEYNLALDEAELASHYVIPDRALAPISSKVAEKCSLWMIASTKSLQSSGNPQECNAVLIDFLKNGPGFRFIKCYDHLCQLSELLQRKGYNTTTPPCKPEEFNLIIEESPPEYFGHFTPSRAKASIHVQAAEKFCQWMSRNEHLHSAINDSSNHNAELIKFLKKGRGFLYVKTYANLCELADLLKHKGYETTNPPCAPDEFNIAIDEANPKSFGNSQPDRTDAPISFKIGEKFHLWANENPDMHRFEGRYQDERSEYCHNQALLEFLRDDNGFKYVKTYAHLCQLAELVKRKGYQVTNPPCEPEAYNKAIETEHNEAIDTVLPESFGSTKPRLAVSRLTTLCYGSIVRYNLMPDSPILTASRTWRGETAEVFHAVEDDLVKIGCAPSSSIARRAREETLHLSDTEDSEDGYSFF